MKLSPTPCDLLPTSSPSPLALADDAPPTEAEGMNVTVGLRGGGERHGAVASFSPYCGAVVVWASEPAWSAAAAVSVPMADVAYVGFHTAAERRSLFGIKDPIELTVRVADRAFRVKASAAEVDRPLGFYAQPAGAQPSPYQCVFFFRDAIALDGAEPRPSQPDAGDRAAPCDRADAMSPHELSQEALRQTQAVMRRRRVRIGDALVEEGLVSRQDITDALAEQKERRGRRLGEVLIDRGLISERQLYEVLGKRFHMRVVDLDETDIDPRAVAAVDAAIIRKYCVLPIAIDTATLTIANGDPLRTEIYDVLRFQVSKRIVEVMAPTTQIERHIDACLRPQQPPRVAVEDILQELEDDAPAAADGPRLDRDPDSHITESDSAIVRLVNKLIVDAYQRGASDIHIEPNGRERRALVRLRIDGACSLYQEIPAEYWRALVSRIKIMAGLDIAQRRKPQDGKIRLRTSHGTLELRVATIPTVHGNEDCVLRMLSSQRSFSLDEMGMTGGNLASVKRAIGQPYGLILCVGPTGSGKTTTLHAALASINDSKRKIWTAEDPVEISQPGLRQVQVNPKIGFAFADAMRAFLRADPDVIMIGEMRDRETAGIAVEASLTGHLVLSTLHTNSAPETVVRLLDLGIDPFAFADALLCVLAQRLGRRICQACREPFAASAEQYAQIAAWYGRDELARRLGVATAADLTLWRAPGCEGCGGTGSAGRIALHELLVVDAGVRRAMYQHARGDHHAAGGTGGTGGTGDALRDAAVAAGMTTLLQDGIEKAIAGETTIKRVLAVCSR